MILTLFFFVCFFVLVAYRIEKQNGCGCLLEHLESYSTDILMSEPNVHQFCVIRNRETNK